MHCDSDASAYEFFAGGGMARLGLGGAWRISFANDIQPDKTAAYARAFGTDHLRTGDVWSIDVNELPGDATLAWASFPCQDLSMAGARAGLDAPRSGAFWGFWRLMEALRAQGRAPRLLALENVPGLLTSRGGADFVELVRVLADAGYTVGAIEIDAAHFVAQSRPRIFVVACLGEPPSPLKSTGPIAPFHGPAVRAAHARLGAREARQWRWWRLPAPPLRNMDLAAILEPDDAAPWRTPEQTQTLLDQMSPAHRDRVQQAMRQSSRSVGALFRRVRVEKGQKVQRAEVRFDGLAGCLRTPAGGSSRQMLVVVDGPSIRTRFMTAREGARLMGLPDDYPLPDSQSRALHLVGDGVVVPVVRWLSQNLLEPMARAQPTQLWTAG